MLQEAASIREAMEQQPRLPSVLPSQRRKAESDDGRASAFAVSVEGGVRERRHQHRERDPKLRRRKIEATKGKLGRIACEVCGFDFAAIYGDQRAGEFIEVHHTTPLHVTGVTKTRIEDLALLCSNCHRMIHIRPPWLTLDQLRSLICTAQPQRAGKGQGVLGGSAG